VDCTLNTETIKKRLVPPVFLSGREGAGPATQKERKIKGAGKRRTGKGAGRGSNRPVDSSKTNPPRAMKGIS